LQKKGVKTFEEELEKKGGFTKIIRLGADLAYKCRNDELRVPKLSNAIGWKM